MVGYRSEKLFGEGYTDAIDVVAWEIFQLGNTDILHTLSNGLLKGTEAGFKLSVLEEEMNNGAISEDDTDGRIWDVYESACGDFSCGGRDFVSQYIIDSIRDLTGTEITEVLWLCDTPEAVQGYAVHSLVGSSNLTYEDIDCYETTNIIISDLGTDGKLYGYTENNLENSYLGPANMVIDDLEL